MDAINIELYTVLKEKKKYVIERNSRVRGGIRYVIVRRTGDAR